MTVSLIFTLAKHEDRQYYWDRDTTPWTLYSRQTEEHPWEAILGSDAPMVAINTQTGTAYTLQLTDANDVVEMNNASANAVTIPLASTSAFAEGTIISITQLGDGTTTVTAAAGVTLNAVDGGSADISAQFAAVSIYNRGEDTWIIQGSHGGVV